MSHKTENLRNIVLVGHGAVGKTTTGDLMLHKAGISTRAGSVQDGSSLLDTDDDEKHHKHSISSSVVHFDHHGKRINLIDTPGYPDFIAHAISGLRAADTAVIYVSATAGIEVNTRRVFNLAGNAGVGRMIVINKCDQDNVNYPALLESITATFGAACVPLNVPVGIGANFSGVVSTLKVPDSVPAGALLKPADVNQQVMDAIAEADEDLMARYLEGEQFSAEEIAAGVAKAISSGSLIPIFCTSSRTGVGIPELMDAFSDLALPPGTVHRTAKDEKGNEAELKADATGPLIAQVFKVRIDPFVGKISYIRIYSGHIKKDATVHTSSSSRAIKVHQLHDVQGAESPLQDDGVAGDIVSIVKIDELKLGDTVTVDGKGPFLPPMPFPIPMIGLAVEPKSRNDQQKISGALQKLQDEDPTFHVRREAQTHEMVIQGMSELHLQIMQERLHKRDKVDVITHQPKIPYRETVNGHAEGHYRHKKQSGGSGQFAEVHFRVAHLPRNIKPEEWFTKERFANMRSFHYDAAHNYAFVDRVSGGTVPNNFIPAVEKGIKERMEKGVIAGYQVQDCTCELFFGKDHPVDSNETAFKIAGSMCFRDVFQQAKPVLLEPIVTIEITVPGEKLGDITSDLNGRRGRVEGMDSAPGGFQTIKAKVPLSEVMTYARALSSMTGGQGSFTLEMSHYDMVPPNEQAKIVAAAVKHKEEEE